jgi:predicted CXXCH cytochrome family protein
VIRRRLLALAVLGLAACGELLPAAPDAGLVTVPLSYHTARATPGHRQHLALEGDKRVLCRDCHALADAGFASPGPGLCARCHEKQLEQHHPLDAGVDLTCLTCHPFAAESAPKRFELWKCITCHHEPQGAKAAITVHRAECQKCHRPHEAPFTEAADCTQCHEVSLKHGAKGETMAGTCMSCHTHHAAADAASRQCAECHVSGKVPMKARVTPGALFRPGHTGCGSCHQAHLFVQGAVKRCERCHESHPVMGALHHTDCVDCHQPHQPRAAAVACQSCHGSEVVKHPKDAQKGACLGCHPVHPKQFDGSPARPCIACHDTKAFTAQVVHAPDTACLDCHRPHDGKPAREPLCVTCHEQPFAEVKPNKGHAKCGECHAGLPHGVGGERKPCLACHEKQQPPQAGHRKDGCGSCHETHSGVVKKPCTACHDVDQARLPGLHKVKEHELCDRCHAPHEPQPGFGPRTCQSCHKKLSLKAHPTQPTQCVGCHLFKDARPGATK